MFLEETDNVEDLEGGPDSWEVVGVSDKRIGIKTSVLEEKKTACDMLKIYVTQLRAGFADYIPEVAKIMIGDSTDPASTGGLVDFVFDETVRSCAATILPHLLQAAAESPQLEGQVGQLWQFFQESLLKAAIDETEFEVLSWQIGAIKDCVEVVGEDGLSPEFLQALTDATINWLKDYEERYQERRAETQDEDFDSDAVVRLKEDEEMDVAVIQEIAHLQHGLFANMTTNYLPYFQQLLPIFQALLDPERGPADRQWSLCVFDDLVEACGPDAEPFAASFVPAMLQYVGDANPHVRQAASYGCGVMAISGGAPFLEYAKEGLTKLMEVVQAPNAREYGNLEATENCISAIAKITRDEAAIGIPLDQTLPLLLSWLPITEDEEEANYVYGYLCELIMAGNPVMCSDEALATFFAIMAHAEGGIGGQLIEKESATGLKIKAAIMHLQAADEAKVGQLFATLDAEAQQRLMANMA